MNAINAIGKHENWTECNDNVLKMFHAEESISSHQLLPNILAEIPVLLFAGDQDLVCNYEGLEEMISRMSWNGATGFTSGDRELQWNVGPVGRTPTPSGVFRTARSLTYVKIFGASHMASYDKPAEVMDMMHRFIGIGGSVGVQSWVEDQPDAPAAALVDQESRTSLGWLLGSAVSGCC